MCSHIFDCRGRRLYQRHIHRCLGWRTRTCQTYQESTLPQTLSCLYPEHTVHTRTCGFFTGKLWLFCYRSPILREELWIPEAHSLDFYHFIHLILKVLSCCNGITYMHIFSLIRPCLFWGRELGTWYTDTLFCWKNYIIPAMDIAWQN